MKGIGYGMIVVSGYFTILFATLIVYVLFYLIHSFAAELPFSVCGNSWNTANCSVREAGANEADFVNNFTTISNLTNVGNLTNVSSSAFTTPPLGSPSYTTTPSEEFFYRNVLRMSDGIDSFGLPDWRLVLLLILTWAMTLVGLIKGVKSLGKVSYFTALFPYIIILTLVVRGCTLDGAGDGISFYLTPRWEKLAEPKVWADAAIQV